jgi:hypothetical protein
MNPYTIIAKNCPWSSDYDEVSFVAILHEKSVWQRDQYWLLEWALYEIVKRKENYEELYGSVFRIFSVTMGSISSHFDQNDLFEIKNLGREEIYEFRERIRIIFEDFFSKHMSERVVFEETNPLLNGKHES